MAKNWRTSALAICALLVSALSAAQMLIDGNPATNPDWNALLAHVFVTFGLFAAKDAKVTGGSIPATPEAEERTTANSG